MTQRASIHRPEGVQVTFRRMRFDFEEGFPRYWHGGSAFRSLFWTQLSTAFGPGERFFIDSARALRSHIDDPALNQEFAEFCRQEGHHTAQHAKFDRINAAMGIDVARCGRRYARWLDLGRRMLGPRARLGITCALEHLTSGWADMMFERPDLSEGGDPRVLALWRWHAIEEAEHRGTCFDVYVAAGGGYLTRVSTLLLAWSLILLISVVNTLRLQATEGRLFTADTARGLGYLFGSRGIVTYLLPAFVRYLSPRFHPWEQPVVDGVVIARWQADNDRFIVRHGVSPAPPAAGWPPTSRCPAPGRSAPDVAR